MAGVPGGVAEPGLWPIAPWTYPEERYYYSWWDPEMTEPVPTSDDEVKSLVVDRLKTNMYTKKR